VLGVVKSSVSDPTRNGGQDRGCRPASLSYSAARCQADLQFAGILPASIALFDAWWHRHLLDGGRAGKLCPLIAKMQHFTHLIEKLRMRVVVSPAAAIAKIDQILLPTLDQSEPSASDTVVRTLLPFRHEASQNAAESALLDNQRALPIRATKMNAVANRLFV